jgi:GH24 family phage-related lysozyme (muramidase)
VNTSEAGRRFIEAQEGSCPSLAELRVAEACVNSHCTLIGLAQHQFDAMVAYIFESGMIAFIRGKLLLLLNRGDIAGAAAEFPCAMQRALFLDTTPTDPPPPDVA